MADAGPLSLPDWILTTLIWGCLATIVLSGVQYVWVWSRKAVAKGFREDR